MALCSSLSANDKDKGFWAILPYHSHSHLERHSNHCAAAMPATTSSSTCKQPTTHHHALPVKTPCAIPTATPSTSFTLHDSPPDLLIAVDTFQQQILEGFCLLLQLPMPTKMTPKPSLPPHQANFSPTSPPQTPTPATAPRQEPVDPNQPTHHNTNNSAQLTLMPPMPPMQLPMTTTMPMIMTTIPTTLCLPSQPPLPEPSPLAPTTKQPITGHLLDDHQILLCRGC